MTEKRKTQMRLVVSSSNSYFGSAGKEFWNHCDFDAESCFADGSVPERGWYLHVPCHCQDAEGFKVSKNVRCEYCINGPGGWEGTRHRLYCKWKVGDRIEVQDHKTMSDITDIRVEQVQSIGIYDIQAEGLEIESDYGPGDDPSDFYDAAREGFRKLWDSINGKRAGCSWADNPWVWVIEFKRAGSESRAAA